MALATAPHESKEAFLRKDFSRSGLVRLLSDWAPVAAQAPRQDIAQRLGQWLDVSDAITLRAAHQSIKSAAAVKLLGAGAGARAGQAKVLEQELHRVRTALVKAIVAGDVSPVRNGRERSHVPQPQAAPEPGAAFAPYQQRYLERQRQMALRIEALRGHVRHVVALASPRLGQLAAMDAALEQWLAGREQKLLGTVLGVLERRFAQLRKAQQFDGDAAAQPDEAAAWRQPGGWLHAFDKELEAALLAELEARLLPVTGLMEALSNELGESQ